MKTYNHCDPLCPTIALDIEGVPPCVEADGGGLPKPYYQDAAVTIYHGDCREIVPQLGRFDLLLTDPPYGIGYKPERNYTGNKKWGQRKPYPSVHGDDADFDGSFLAGVAGKSILWGANHYADTLPKSGSWLVWDKKNGGALARGFTASDAELAWTDFDGCLVKLFSHMWHGLVRDSEIGVHLHPTQKPLELMRWCIGLAGDVQTILDPFAGSCTTARAAKDLGRKCVCIEREERYCEIGAKRMAQEVFAL